MKINESQKGNMYIISEMILWSLFPIVSILGLKGLSSLVSLFWVNVFASLFFLVLMIRSNKWSELNDKKLWLYTLGTVFFICVMFYGLYFYALTKTTPANAAIVALFEIVPTFIFFQVIKKEHIKNKHIIGIILAVVGALIVLLPKASVVHPGDWILLGAVFFPPIGNWYQQRSRKLASSETVLFLRHIMTAPILLLIIYVIGGSVSIHEISNNFWWLLLNGIFIFGLSKIFWVEALHRMSVTRAIAISGLGPIFTVLFAWLILAERPTIVQLLSLPFLIVSVLLLTNVTFGKDLSITNE